MLYCWLTGILSVLLCVLPGLPGPERDKDVEILLLRYQLCMLQRRLDHKVRPSRGEKLVLAALVDTLKGLRRGTECAWDRSILLFTPATILRWHRELVRRKWTFTRRRGAGRPRITAEIEAMILRLARENPDWGYSRIHGELSKLDYVVGRSTVRDVLKRQRGLGHMTVDVFGKGTFRIRVPAVVDSAYHHVNVTRARSKVCRHWMTSTNWPCALPTRCSTTTR